MRHVRIEDAKCGRFGERVKLLSEEDEDPTLMARVDDEIRKETRK